MKNSLFARMAARLGWERLSAYLAPTFKISTECRNLACDAVVDEIDTGGGAGHIDHRSGSEPSNVSDASTGTLLGTNPLSATAFGAASTGVATAAAITSDTNADGSGDAGYFRGYKNGAADTEADWQGNSGESADTPTMEFDNKTIVAGGTIAISAMTITMPIS